MSNIFDSKPEFFIGQEVERTKFFGENTLFVKGDVSLSKLIQVLSSWNADYSITHIYLGSSKTHAFLLINEELNSILHFLSSCGYHVTIESEYSDVDWYVDLLSKYSNIVLNISLSMNFRLLERVSVKLEPTIPFKDGVGVYCMTPKMENFTPWSAYYEDKII